MRPIVRDALGVGVAVGALGLSFGALAVASGLTVLQACALSLLMFTGASQFAFVGLIGGGAASAVATALLLGARNALYGLRLAPFLRPRMVAAHLVIDESAAMSVRDTPEDTRLGFWSAGLAVFVGWNAATAIGAVAGNAISDPSAFGLDAAAPAAFLALLAPRLRAREPQVIAALAAAAALASVPLVPAGTPVMVAAAVAVVAALVWRGEERRSDAVAAYGDAPRGAGAAAAEDARRGAGAAGAEDARRGAGAAAAGDEARRDAAARLGAA
jgi:predicted branched-subunit amino acid permease